MSPELWELFSKWVEALIDEKIEQAFGRDAGSEWCRVYELSQEIKEKLHVA
jgi:hypothetical protein